MVVGIHGGESCTFYSRLEAEKWDTKRGHGKIQPPKTQPQ
jgi:hypothetical protein